MSENNLKYFQANNKGTPMKNFLELKEIDRNVSPKKKQYHQTDEVMVLNLKKTGSKPEKFDTTNKYIISNIENVYLSIKEDKTHKIPKYYSSFRILIFLLSLFSMSYLWLVTSITGPVKNNYYCLDAFSKEFRLCDANEFCDNTHYGPVYMIFTSDKNIANQSIIEEVYRINEKYLKFFLKDSILFSIQNTKNDMYKEMDSFYSIVFAITYEENWNFFNCFNQYCNKTLTFMQISIICFLGLIASNFVVGFLADVFGRKPLVIACGLIQSIGVILCFFISQMILEVDIDSTTMSSFNNLFYYNSTLNDRNIFNFYNSYNLSGFEVSGFNDLYSKNFTRNMQDLIRTKIIQYNFSSYKFLFLVGFLCLYSSLSGMGNVLLAYVMENSLNDSKVFSNYIMITFSIPISYVIQYILLTLFNSFHLPMLIIGLCNLMVTICFSIFMYESPRYHYEYYEYDKLTHFFNSVFVPDDLQEFYTFIRPRKKDEKKENLNKWEKEFYKGNSHLNFLQIVCNNIVFLGVKKIKERSQKMLEGGKSFDFNRGDFIKNPFFIFQIMMSNKNIKRNLWILVALTANIGLIFFLTISKLNLTLVFSRELLYKNIIINSTPFWIGITMIISIYSFDFLLKFFGFSVVLYVSFPFIFIFSLTFELLSLGDRSPEDMNSYKFNSIEIIYKDRRSSLVGILFILVFFATGVFSSLFFYLTKFTKTLYRCTFYGIFRFILDFTTFFSVALSQFFEKNFFYVSVLSVIGFVNIYFLQENFDSIVEDFRVLEFTDD
jgi:hypothetical protein